MSVKNDEEQLNLWSQAIVEEKLRKKNWERLLIAAEVLSIEQENAKRCDKGSESSNRGIEVDDESHAGADTAE